MACRKAPDRQYNRRKRGPDCRIWPQMNIIAVPCCTWIHLANGEGRIRAVLLSLRSCILFDGNESRQQSWASVYSNLGDQAKQSTGLERCKLTQTAFN